MQNKNAATRYRILDNCFRNPGRKYFIDDLINECDKVLLEKNPASNGISRRQIFMDISYMESKDGWEIELVKKRVDKKVYYRYADTSYSINNMPLNNVEINRLLEAVDVISQFKGMPQFEWIHELEAKLKQGIVVEEVDNTIMEFDNNQYLKGIENLGTLHNAIFYKKILSISYQPFSSEIPYEVVIHPYFLKQYNNRWFLFGYNPEMDRYDWNMALDRMVEIKEIKGEYKKNNVINWQDYFDDIIGVTKPLEAVLENVVLHFDSSSGKYIETKPLHGSQKKPIWIDQDTLEVRLELLINYELERLILSYGDAVKVIKPIQLVEKIKNRLMEASNKYD